jgi:biopolymer transport protein ExbB
MRQLFEQAIEIWLSGGWAMIALGLNALILFFVGSNMWLNFKTMGLKAVPEKKWRKWVKDPEKGRGRIGELIRFLMTASTIEGVQVRFNELHATEVAPFARDLRFMKRSVSASPLLGLLGTVTGMLTTFQALATGSGGEKTMSMIASGISEALITTETGLIIALPGVFFEYYLRRERDRYEAFLAHLETACTQHMYWKTVGKKRREQEAQSKQGEAS